MTDTTDAAGLGQHERRLEIMDGLTLTLLAVGAALAVLLVHRIDPEIVLLVAAGLMLGVSTVISIHRRRTGYEPVTRGQPFGPEFLLRIAPSLMLLTAAIIGLVETG